jgi:hypothetical protein
LSSTAAPAANAGTTSIPGITNGKFHGVMTPTTGYGRYTVVSFLVMVNGLSDAGRSSARNRSACPLQ